MSTTPKKKQSKLRRRRTIFKAFYLLFSHSSLLNFFDVDLEHTRGPGPIDHSYKDLETKAETTDESSFGDSAVKALKAAQSVAYKIIKDL